MKIIDKIANAIFSNIILIISIILIIIIFGWLDIDIFFGVIAFLVSNELASNITLGVCIVLILLAVKCIFFGLHESSGEHSKDRHTIGKRQWKASNF